MLTLSSSAAGAAAATTASAEQRGWLEPAEEELAGFFLQDFFLKNLLVELINVYNWFVK